MAEYSRREWLKLAALTQAGLFLGNKSLFATCIDPLPKPKTILLVSGWQDINIGDIAHTPGLLHVLETFMPEAKVILWKVANGAEVIALLQKAFPKVKIVTGTPDANFDVSNPEVLQAFKDADVMLHGSGPGIVGKSHLQAWVKATTKPFGIFGTTIDPVTADLKTLLAKADFIYTRETESIKVLAAAGLTGNNISFAPDATFFMHIRDDAKAKAFMDANGLEERKFICAIPRLRKTPYWIEKPGSYTADQIATYEALNEKWKEPDSAKLREAMIAWVRETKNKVLVCPEMTYQVDVMDEMLIDPLPADVKPYIVKRGYWWPDEAASTYVKAHTVLSMECHSPIIAAANGTPFFYLRQPQDTIKGQMYYDLGFADWTFEIEDTQGSQIAARLKSVWENYSDARVKVATARKNIEKIYAKGVDAVYKMGTA